METGPCLRTCKRSVELPSADVGSVEPIRRRSARLTPKAGESLESKADSVERSGPTKRQQSKRQASPATSEAPSPKRNSASRRSKRRSSFVRGRLANPAVDQRINDSADLLKDIDADLTREEKLQKLTVMALEFTLRSLSREFSNLQGIQQFEVQVRDTSSGLVEKIAKEGIFSQAVGRNRSGTDPVSLAIQQATNECQKLQREVSGWDEVLQDRKEQAQRARAMANDLEDHLITEPPSSLNSSQMAILSTRPDYRQLLDSVSRTRDEVELMVDELGRGVSVLQGFLRHTEDYLELQAQEISAVTFSGLPNVSNPNVLISKLAST